MLIERRTEKRLSCNITAKVKILIPEQTFTPYEHEAMIMDISIRGMKLRTWEIDADVYRILLGSSRLIRVSFTPPGGNAPHTIYGKIHWLDFNNLSKMPITTYGIHFEDTNEEDIRVVNLCLKAISETTQ